MEDFAQTLIDIFTAGSVEQTVSLGLNALVRLLQPQQYIGLLLWDGGLGRYIIGDTWLDVSIQSDGAAVRRKMLAWAREAHAQDHTSGRYLESELFFQPLNARGEHIGALICQGVDQLPETNKEYEALANVMAAALYSAVRLQEATGEHAQLTADRLRLENLLAAVEQQQLTIDRLLAIEREFSASLEAKVEERTNELRAAQSRLIKSEKLAVIGHLASSLAHELNNPLQAMQSGLGLAMDEIASGSAGQARADLEVIQGELERIDAILRQMLDFYRPAASDYAAIDLNAICRGVEMLIRKRLQEANVALRLALTPDLPLTCGDSNQIKQVLINLLLNAAESMPASGGRITLHTERARQDVCVRVSDNGTGIDEQHLPRLFEPLFTTRTRGLGLGLAITQEIVERHHGRIAVESVAGEGATFTVILPVRDDCHEQP